MVQPRLLRPARGRGQMERQSGLFQGEFCSKHPRHHRLPLPKSQSCQSLKEIQTPGAFPLHRTGNGRDEALLPSVCPHGQPVLTQRMRTIARTRWVCLNVFGSFEYSKLWGFFACSVLQPRDREEEFLLNPTRTSLPVPCSTNKDLGQVLGTATVCK